MSIHIYTDGACSGNPGPGGYAAHMVFEYNDGKKIHELGGFVEATTNNRMELAAPIAALYYLRRLQERTESDFFLKHGSVFVYSDSSYVVNGCKEWLTNWKKNNWVTSSKKKVKNRDLWEILDVLSDEFEVEWRKVKGHSDHAENNRADELAVQFCKNDPKNLQQDLPKLSISGSYYTKINQPVSENDGAPVVS